MKLSRFLGMFLMDGGIISLIPVIAVTLFVIFLLFTDKSPECDGDLKTSEGGYYKVVEIETHGEKHEYLYFHKMYGRSVCHLPNCRYCKPAE